MDSKMGTLATRPLAAREQPLGPCFRTVDNVRSTAALYQEPRGGLSRGRVAANSPQTTNQTQTDSLSPSPNPVSPVPLNNQTSAPRYGTVIPNRIFVGGIDFKAEKLNYKDKKLNIGPAIRKQQIGIPRSSIMPAAGTMYLTTSTGYPYTYHNGVAYFHTPEVTSVPPSWPSRSISSSPVMVAQPVYQQPAYHYQPSEVIYQPVEIAQDGGCVPPALSLMEASVPEPYSDHGVQAAYHQVYAPGAVMPAPVMQPEPIKTIHLMVNGDRKRERGPCDEMYPKNP
ncbi:Protein boule-like [Microtus ochrogaster]|uniref:Protein boule-like n=1 Tax=Microtus ochrogaster TaxID=79684 RepID=A0A8J6KU17_MICOH|nr:Protein boule-like [Microtus ochrogaster]